MGWTFRVIDYGGGRAPWRNHKSASWVKPLEDLVSSNLTPLHCFWQAVYSQWSFSSCSTPSAHFTSLPGVCYLIISIFLWTPMRSSQVLNPFIVQGVFFVGTVSTDVIFLDSWGYTFKVRKETPENEICQNDLTTSTQGPRCSRAFVCITQSFQQFPNDV